jgi:hypothetical protein
MSEGSEVYGFYDEAHQRIPMRHDLVLHPKYMNNGFLMANERTHYADEIVDFDGNIPENIISGLGRYDLRMIDEDYSGVDGKDFVTRVAPQVEFPLVSELEILQERLIQPRKTRHYWHGQKRG